MTNQSYCDCGTLTADDLGDGMVLCNRCAELDSLRNENAKLRAKVEKMEMAIDEARDEAHVAPELNMSNYSEEQVDELNDAMIKVHQALLPVWQTISESEAP